MGYHLEDTTLQKMRRPWVIRCTCGFEKLFAMSREDSLREYLLSDHDLNFNRRATDHSMVSIPMDDYLNETGRL